ncbi:MAG: hypothetical protein ACLFV5_01625 [Anaerolineales bacterium]
MSRFAAIWSYPWDLLDEGLGDSLSRIAGMGLDGISLAVSYHAGMLLLPHNPRKKIRFLEDGALYFRPHGGHFDGLALQPRISRLAADGDPLAAICAAAERKDLEVVAWTICNHNNHQGESHPDVVMRNAFGDPLLYALCPSHPDVQAYLQALVQELSDYPIRTLQLESCGFMGFPHDYHHEKIRMDLGATGRYLMGLCFCPACRKVAHKEGVALDAAQKATRRYLEDVLAGRIPPTETLSEECLLDELPQLAPYLRMREEIVGRLIGRLRDTAEKPLNLLDMGGMPDPDLVSRVHEVTVCAYKVGADEVATTTRAARESIKSPVRLGIGIEACPLLSPNEENMVSKVGAAWDAGADALYFYNYGLVPLKSLDWIAKSLRA